MAADPFAEAADRKRRTDEQADATATHATNRRDNSPGATFQLSSEAIDSGRLAEAMSDDRAGACVTFEGRVRNSNEGRAVTELEYEAYPRMALKEGARVLAEAHRRFEIIDARCIHRLGRLQIGDAAVWVGVLSGHREEGFAACRFIIDEVKARVPIWKKERYREGDSSWVNGSAVSEESP